MDEGAGREHALTIPWPWLLTLTLLVGLQLPTLRAVARYGHGLILPGALVLLIAATAGYFWLSRRQGPAWRERVTGPTMVAGLMMAMAAAAAWLYPIADGLKVHMRGSDMDDAVQVAVAGLLAGTSPYAGSTYMHTPLSPGPGLVLYYTLFVPWGGYAFGAVAGMAGAAATLRRVTGAWRVPALFLALSASAVFFWEMLVIGSDLIVVGCGLIAVAATLRAPRNGGWLAAAGVLCGLIATSRIVFLYLPAVFALVLWQRSKGQAIVFAAGATTLALALHAWLYLKGPALYSPLHLLGKGQALMPGPFKLATAAACLVAGAAAIAVARRSRLAAYEVPLLCLGVPLLGIALAELAFRGWDLKAWEGATYLMPVLPLTCAWTAERLGTLWERPSTTTTELPNAC